MVDNVTKISSEDLKASVESARDRAGSAPAKPSPHFVTHSISEFLGLDIKPRAHLLSPWLPEQGLCMLQAYRGVGKTHVALGIAFAVATGGEFLGWQAPKPRGVLYIDGEMPASTMQERLARIVKASDKTDADKFKLLTPDMQEFGVPNLASHRHQDILAPLLKDVDLIVLDNISTLIRTTHSENDEKSWAEIQTWLLKQRSQERSVLLVHHEGKGGLQRGTSKREDILDTVIQLRRPEDYEPSLGASFEVIFKKNRGFYGDEAKSFQAQLDPETGLWACTDLETATFDKVVELMRQEDVSQVDIAHELNINKSTVSRHVKRAKSEGKL